jgi:hypothetical protein
MLYFQINPASINFAQNGILTYLLESCSSLLCIFPSEQNKEKYQKYNIIEHNRTIFLFFYTKSRWCFCFSVASIIFSISPFFVPNLTFQWLGQAYILRFSASKLFFSDLNLFFEGTIKTVDNIEQESV